ncbi:MAG: flippase [Candidatus Eiseniibacteriota bacterium]
MIKRIALNTIAMVSGQAAVKALGLLWLVVVARHLGEAGFGFLNFALSLTAIFSVLVEFGFSPVLTRDVARDAGVAEDYLANVLGLRLVLSLVVVPLTVAVSLLTGADRGTLAPVLVLALTMVTSAVWAAPNSVFVARERMGHPSVVITISKLVALGVGLVLVSRGAGLLAVASVFLLEGVLNLAVGIPLLTRVLGVRVRVALDPALCRRLLREAAPFALTLAFGLLYFKLDVVMLSAMKGSEAVGRYSAAFRLLEGLVYLSAAFVGTMFPVLSRLHATSEEQLRSTTRRALDAVVAFALPAAVALMMLAAPIIRILYGPDYAGSVPVLRWIGAALVFVFAGNLLASVLSAVDRQKDCLRVTVAGVALNLALNLALIPRLAELGAAVATTVTQAMVAAAMFALVQRHVRPGVDAVRQAKIFLATAALAATLFALLQSGFLLAVVAGTVAYLAVLAGTRVLTAEERRQVRAAVSGAADG